MKRFFTAALSFLLALSLSACGSGTKDPEPAESTAADSPAASPAAAVSTDEGIYYCLGMETNGSVIKTESLADYTIELTGDGAGTLYFGEDNQGPITSWSSDNGKFTMKAGVSDFEGELSNGIMHLDFGDGLVLIFAKKDADTSSLNFNVSESSTLSGDAKVDPAVAGRYISYAIKVNDVVVDVSDTGDPEDYMELELREDGTGQAIVGSEHTPMRWAVDGEKLIIIEEDGSTSEGSFTITVKDGVITWVFPPGTAGETEITQYFAVEGADVSWLNAVKP